MYRESELFRRRCAQQDCLHINISRIRLKEHELYSSDDEPESSASEIIDEDRATLERELQICKYEKAHLVEELHEYKIKMQQKQLRCRLWLRDQVKEKQKYIETAIGVLEENNSLRMKLRSQSELLGMKNAKHLNEKYVYIYEKEEYRYFLECQLYRARKELEITKAELRKMKKEKDLLYKRMYNIEKDAERMHLETKHPEHITYRMVNNESYGYKPLLPGAEKSNKLFAVDERSRQVFVNVKERTPELEITQFEKQESFEQNNKRNKENVCRIEGLEVEKQRLVKELEHRDFKLKQQQKLLKERDNTQQENTKLTNELNVKERKLQELNKQVGVYNQRIKELERLLSKTETAGIRETNVTRFKELEAQLKEITSDRDSELKRRQDLERKTRQKEARIQELEQEYDKAVNLQKQKIERLQKDLDQRNLIKEDVTGRMATRIADTEKERELRQKLKSKEDMLSEQKIHLQQVLSKLKETEAKLINTASERDSERRSKQLLDDKDKVSKMKIKDLERANDLTTKEQNKKIKQLQDDLENRDKKIKELEERLRNTKTEGLIRNDFGNASSQKEKMISKLEDQLNQALIKLKKTETELEETKTRLSKSLGDKLTDNNPNVADLSDKNRPVKLAERYGELYDNQWTDAFEILNKYYDNEEHTIIALLEILKDVMGFCKSTGSKQMKDLQSILGFSGIPVEDIPTDVRKHLKDCRKAMGLITVRNLYEEYLSHLKRSAHEKLKKASEVPAYVRECLELCWLMVIQDPPVVLAPVAKQGSRLNTDLFKPYTRTGPFVEFTVWPALLLHDGGPVLAKGVAQGVGT